MTQASYDLGQCQERFWRRDDRYYWCASRRTGKGGQRETLCADLEEAHRLIQDVLKHRRYREYVLD